MKTSIENDINLADYGVMKKSLDHANLQRDLENKFTDKWVDEYNVQGKNPFSSGFQFDYMTNQLTGHSNEHINPIFKNFSSEGYSGNIF